MKNNKKTPRYVDIKKYIIIQHFYRKTNFAAMLKNI